MWERVDGGYRVLDWEAVEVCLDHVREIRGEDAQASAQGGGYHVDAVYDSLCMTRCISKTSPDDCTAW